MKHGNPTIRAAYEECRRLARRHYENFPTASYLVPADRRDALAAIYAFARYADDVADEPDVEHRLEKLEEWRQRLRACYAGQPDHPVFVALADSVERFRLSQENFENLLRAFESDVKMNRHPSFDSLLAYCACSANPVGRLVLELFTHREPELRELSDSICTALQLANFWQDVAIDFSRDRVYLPAEDMAACGYSLDDLRAGRVDERWIKLLTMEIQRTWLLFENGRSLPEKVVPRLRKQLRLTWLGGTEILRRIESCGCDVFQRRPSLSRWDFIRFYLQARRPLAAAGVRALPDLTVNGQ
jgi:squalene synthase HpnC